MYVFHLKSKHITYFGKNRKKNKLPIIKTISAFKMLPFFFLLSIFFFLIISKV